MLSWPSAADRAGCPDVAVCKDPARNFDGRVDLDISACHGKSEDGTTIHCDLECLVGDWSSWGRISKSTPEDIVIQDIWAQSASGLLMVERTRQVTMPPSNGNMTACPATVEFQPWRDHCSRTMGIEKNDRSCDTSACTSGSDTVSCHHSAERCDDKAYTRIAVSYRKHHRCDEIGWAMTSSPTESPTQNPTESPTHNGEEER